MPEKLRWKLVKTQLLQFEWEEKKSFCGIKVKGQKVCYSIVEDFLDRGEWL